MSLTYSQIDSLIDALMANAKSLIFEAETLQSVSAFARAYALAHLAREEISKCGILYAAGTRMLAGVSVDWRKTMRRLRDHKAKLELETAGQLLLLGAADKLGAITKIVEHRNDRKNASLYVGLVEGKAMLPSDVVSAKQASRTIELAKNALELQEKIRVTSGAFVNRKPSPIPGLSDIEKMTPEQMKSAFVALAPVYQQIVALTMSHGETDVKTTS